MSFVGWFMLMFPFSFQGVLVRIFLLHVVLRPSEGLACCRLQSWQLDHGFGRVYCQEHLRRTAALNLKMYVPPWLKGERKIDEKDKTPIFWVQHVGSFSGWNTWFVLIVFAWLKREIIPVADLYQLYSDPAWFGGQKTVGFRYVYSVYVIIYIICVYIFTVRHYLQIYTYIYICMYIT